MPNFFRNLFVPQKNLPDFSQQAFRTDMQAIESWANSFSNMSYTVQIGSPPPSNIQTSLVMGVTTVTCSGGLGDYLFPVPYKYGYVALVCSGYYAAADSMAVNSAASSLDILEVYATLAGSPVSGPVDLVYLIVGA